MSSVFFFFFVNQNYLTTFLSADTLHIDKKPFLTLTKSYYIRLALSRGGRRIEDGVLLVTTISVVAKLFERFGNR